MSFFGWYFDIISMYVLYFLWKKEFLCEAKKKNIERYKPEVHLASNKLLFMYNLESMNPNF